MSIRIIVIGSHGRTGVRRALLGSVAEAVMRNAPCPVLVARAQSSPTIFGSARGPSPQINGT
jgi:Universal stress protein family